MQTGLTFVEDVSLHPRVLRNCSFCGEITPHEIRPAEVPACVRCEERALAFELDRD